MMDTESYKNLWMRLSELIKLYWANTKLTVAEKAARLMATIALCAIVFVLGVLAFFFLSIALVYWIASGTGTEWAYLIMGGFYLLLIIVFVLFKKQLIANPICKFISQLLLS